MLVLSVGLFVGCAGPEPTSTPAATATPSPKWSEPEAIAIGKQEFLWRASMIEIPDCEIELMSCTYFDGRGVPNSIILGRL